MDEHSAPTCQATHPGWADGSDYRRLAGDPPRLRRMTEPVVVTRIDHERNALAGEFHLEAGDLVWWHGSAWTTGPHGEALSREVVFEVLAGDEQGECFELSLLGERGLPDSFAPVE